MKQMDLGFDRTDATKHRTTAPPPSPPKDSLKELIAQQKRNRQAYAAWRVFGGIVGQG